MKEFFNSIGNWFENNWRPIVTVVAIAVIGFILVKLILALVKRQLGKTKLDRALQGFVLSILKFVLYLILIFSIISSLGISITGLTVVATALSLAISLALQDSLKNLVNGFIVISTGLLKQGDWVKVAGVEGSVIDVKMLFTVLKTGDNKKITIPNSTILSSEVINYNTLKSRRVDMDFTIAYNSNVDLAKKVINEVIDSCEMIYNDPAPSVVLSNLGESALTITVKVWCSSDDYWDTKWYVIDHVFNELKRNDISIPFNQLEVAIVEPNQKTYVREEKLTAAKSHKVKAAEEDDIISSINKKFKKVTKITKKKNKNKKETEVKEPENKDENK